MKWSLNHSSSGFSWTYLTMNTLYLQHVSFVNGSEAFLNQLQTGNQKISTRDVKLTKKKIENYVQLEMRNLYDNNYVDFDFISGFHKKKISPIWGIILCDYKRISDIYIEPNRAKILFSSTDKNWWAIFDILFPPRQTKFVLDQSIDQKRFVSEIEHKAT